MTGDVIWDLFCGAGGFSLGFYGKDNEVTGFDMNKLALETYYYNISKVFKKVSSLPMDILKIKIVEVDDEWVRFTYGNDKLFLKKPNILIGSPPCQDFSLANRYKTKDTTLVEKFLEIKDAINPRWWVMEEVPPVGKIGEEKGWFKARYLKACEFNLPHVRKRLFAGNYPPPMKHHYQGMQIFTPRGREPGKGWDGWDGKKGKQTGRDVLPRWNKFLLNTPQAEIRGYGHGKDKRNELKKMFGELEDLIGKDGLIPTLRSQRGFSFGNFEANKKISSRKRELNEMKDIISNGDTVPTPTQTDYKGRAKSDDLLKKRSRVHYAFTDVITPELCAWIMGFPSWYNFQGSKTDQYRQIGNAVCPPIARAIYKAILNPPVEMETLR